MTLHSSEDASLKRSILIVAAFAAFLPAFMVSSVVLALPTIGEHYGADAIELGWFLNAFSLSTGVVLLISGRVGDMVGRKRIFSLGMLFFTLSSFLIVFSPNITVFIIMRIIQGITNAMVVSTMMAIVTVVFEPGERGRAVGINLTSTYMGISLGPVIGGVLVQNLGWQSVFLSMVPLQILCLVLIKLKMKSEWADSSGDKFDYKGSVIYGITLFGLMYGFTVLPSLLGWLCMAGGILFGVLFVFVELKVTNPVFEVRLFANNRMFTFSSLTSIVIYSSIGAIGFFSSLYLQYLKDLDATTTGLIMVTQPLATALLSTLSGKLSDRINPGVLASIGMGIVSIGLGLFWFIDAATPIIFPILFLAVIGLGFGMFSSPNTNAIMSSVERRYLGLASGSLGTMRTIGQMISMGIAMMLFSFYIGREVITPQVYGALMLSIRTGFLVYALICGLGIFVSLARNKR